jgi:hypothetical protein
MCIEDVSIVFFNSIPLSRKLSGPPEGDLLIYNYFESPTLRDLGVKIDLNIT